MTFVIAIAPLLCYEFLQTINHAFLAGSGNPYPRSSPPNLAILLFPFRSRCTPPFLRGRYGYPAWPLTSFPLRN